MGEKSEIYCNCVLDIRDTILNRIFLWLCWLRILCFWLFWCGLIDWSNMLSGILAGERDKFDGVFMVWYCIVYWRGWMSGYLTNIVEWVRAIILVICSTSFSFFPLSYGWVRKEVSQVSSGKTELAKLEPTYLFYFIPEPIIDRGEKKKEKRENLENINRGFYHRIASMCVWVSSRYHK